MEMTREQFMELFKLTEDNMEELELDQDHENGESWFEIAQGIISQMNSLLVKHI